MRLRIFALAATSVSLLVAADFWKDKPAAEWNDKEVKQLLSKSPWARETTLQIKGMPAGGMGGGSGRRGGGGGGDASMGNLGGGGGGGMTGPAGTNAGPGMGVEGAMGGAGGMQMPKATVRWDSAKPVQEAMAKAEIAMPEKMKSGEFYVVSINGVPPVGLRGMGGGQQDPQQMKQKLMDAAALNVKGMDPIKAADVEATRGPDGIMLRYYFPKTKPIEAGQKEVTFKFEMGPAMIETKFGLKDMVYGGGLSI